MADYRVDSFSQILNDIHDKIRNEIKDTKLKAQSQIIQNTLRDVKRAVLRMRENKKQGIEGVIETELDQIIVDAFESQRMAHKTLKSAIPFLRSHKINSIKGADDIFEEDFAYLVAEMMKTRTSLGSSVSADLILTGQEYVSIKSLEGLDKIADLTEEKIIKKMNEIVDKKVKNINSKSKNYSGITIRAGKVDARIPEMEVIGNVDDLINKFLNVIAGKTFSFKNYSSYGKDDLSALDIHFGESNPYKAITGPLSDFYSSEDSNIIFYRGLTILNGESEPPDSATVDQINQHFGHLRFIYELKGNGLINERGESSTVDYIVWNDPYTENIIVRDTNSIIQALIDTRKLGAFSGVSLSASRLMSI